MPIKRPLLGFKDIKKPRPVSGVFELSIIRLVASAYEFIATVLPPAGFRMFGAEGAFFAIADCPHSAVRNAQVCHIILGRVSTTIAESNIILD